MKQNQFGEVHQLLKSNELEVNWRNQNEKFHTALHVACEFGYVEIVQLLLCHPQINVNLRGALHCTPLMHACKEGKLDVVEMLLEDGRADANISDIDNNSPLWWASRHGYSKIVKLMIALCGITLKNSVLLLGLDYEEKKFSSAIEVAQDKGFSDISALLTQFKDNSDVTQKSLQSELQVSVTPVTRADFPGNLENISPPKSVPEVSGEPFSFFDILKRD